MSLFVASVREKQSKHLISYCLCSFTIVFAFIGQITFFVLTYPVGSTLRLQQALHWLVVTGIITSEAGHSKVAPLWFFGAPCLAPFFALKPWLFAFICLFAEGGVLEFLYFLSSFSSLSFSFRRSI